MRRIAWRSKRSCGFTLIELLTVVVIIGILAGLVSTAVLRAKDHAKVVAMQTETQTIQSAIDAYRFEYQRWPCPDPAEGETTKEYKDNNRIVVNDYLMGLQPGRNDRNIRFLDMGNYRYDASSNIIDPYGRAYVIKFDFTNDSVSVVNQ